MSSPTSRTLAFYRDQGSTAQVVERWCSFSRKRKDLFNVIDLVVLHENALYGVQATSGSNHSARREKSLAEPNLRKWLSCGGRFVIISWSKRVARNKDGSKSKRLEWTPRVEELTLADLDARSVLVTAHPIQS